MEFKGTKGIWTIDPIHGFNECNACYLAIDAMSVYNFEAGKQEIIDVYGKDEDDKEMKANALLISKAPELLAKLQYLYSMDLLKDHEESVLKLIKEATEL